jgi:hypothetical protein
MFTDVQLPVRQGWGWGRGEARIPPAAPTPLTLPYTLLYIRTVHELCSRTVGEYRLCMLAGSVPAKRYTKKPRQALVSSSLDSLGLSAAVAHVFHLQKTSLTDSWGRGDGVCVLYCRFQGVCKVTISPLLSKVTSYFCRK